MDSNHRQAAALRQAIDKVAEHISQLVIQEQQAMNADFIIMSGIVQEAAENLRECFSEMSDQLARQSTQLRAKHHESPPPPDDDTQASMPATGETSSPVSKAIRSLQFEDIMQQMINHSRRRAEEIEKLFIALTNHIDGLHPDKTLSPEQMIEILENCLADIHAVDQALDLKSPVRQQSLTRGDVEVF